MPRFTDRFAAGTPRGVSDVTKDSAGRLIAWTENGFSVTVQRSAAGKPLAVTATMPGVGSIVWGFEYNVSGNFSGYSGTQIPTVFTDLLVADAAAMANPQGGLVPVLRDPGTNTLDPTQQSAVSGAVAVRSKLRASIAKASTLNSVDATPYYKPPVWTTNTGYQKGQVVSSTDGVNAFMSYTWQNNAFTTSAASGSGPTGSGQAWVADGSINWEWVGPIRGQSAFNASAVTITNESAAYAAISNYREFSIVPGGGYDGMFTGGMQDTKYGRYWMSASNDLTPAAPRYQNALAGSFTFMTNANKFAILTGMPLYQAGPSKFRIEVNDVLLSDTCYMNMGATSSANPGAIVVDLGDFFKAGTEKKIRIYSDDGANFVRVVLVSQGYDVWQYSNPNRLFMAVEGDSLTAGGNGTPYAPGLDWVTQTANLLGIERYANFAQGSCGFLSNGNGSKSTHLDRLARLISLSADIYLVAGNHNDVGGSYTSQLRQAAMTSWLTQLQAARPNALIIGVGNTITRGESAASQPGGSLYVAEQDMATVFNKYADGRTFFVPVMTDSAFGPWFTGTGTIQAPAYNGNQFMYFSADQSGINAADSHPIQRGTTYLARRYAQAIKSIAL